MKPDGLPEAALTAVDYDPFAAVTLDRVVPSTEAQREIWLAAKLSTDASLAYNESVSLRLRGHLEVEALHGALVELVQRHDALRATFGPDGETLCVLQQAELPLPLLDLTGLAEAASETALAERLRNAVETPFALEQGPLFRAELVRCAADDHRLLLTAHHIVCDGWSWWVIVRELATLYGTRVGAPGEPLPPTESFADYALAQARPSDGKTLAADEAYWLARYADPAPALDLPTDRARPPRRTFASARLDHVLDAALLTAIRRLGAHRGSSLFATLLGSFAAVLTRLAGQSEVVVGIAAAAQSIDGHDHLVGHCVNLLPLRCAPDPAAPLARLLDDTQTTLLDALDHQRYTFGTLLKKLGVPRDPSRLPLVSVLFNIDQALDHEATAFAGASMSFASTPRSFENFELFINAVQEHGELRLECQYNRDLFDQATIRRWLGAYETLLRAAVANPEALLGELPLVDETGRRELLALQPAATPVPAQRVQALFEAQCDRTPDRVAVRCEAQSASYAELEARANRIAHLLQSHGVHDGALVGIALDRSIDMLAAMLGALKAGAGYVPLDPGFPAERLNYMVSDASLAVLITHSRHAARFDLRGRPVLQLDQAETELAAAPATRRPHAQAPDAEAIAYVIYTSGSTGQPKGVEIPHRAVVNFLTSMLERPGLRADDRLVAVTTLSFDIAVLELFGPLCVGGEVVLASRDDAMDGETLKALLASSRATVMQATPATWRLLLQAGWCGSPGFRALCGGEALPEELAVQLLARCSELWNLYGPTETTVWSTCWRVEHPHQGIAIGTPIGNTSVWILDEQRQLCPIGVPGEIWIGGAGIALGYRHRPELTAERFIADPYSDQPDARLYRTGDRGRWLANGTLEHLGRLDFQVKLRGFRIELGEIESVLAAEPEVARVVVVAREDRPGDVRLVAYVVMRGGAEFDEDALRAALRQRLPEYMTPQHVIQLDAIPLLPNGKIDRKRLPLPAVQSVAASNARIAPRNEHEQRVAAAMEAVLAVPNLDVRDNFFSLGGHSLLAAQLTARLNREFGITLSFRTLFDAPSIEQLAAAITAQDSSDATPVAEPIERRANQDRAPLSLMQQRLWALEELQPGRVTYHAPSAHRLRGHLDETAFERALQVLIQRQAALRTAFRHDGEQVEQVIEPALELRLFPAEDLTALPDNERDTALMQRLQALIDTPFDLTRAPLFAVRMFRVREREHVFFFMPHHIIWDGWSFDIFYAEMAQLYGAFSRGEPSPLAPLPVSYGDFAAWHQQWLNGPQLQQQLAFWRERLAQRPGGSALPTDLARGTGMSNEGRTQWVRVPLADTEAMHQVAQQAGATLNMALLALYYVLLGTVAGQRELVVGTPVRARSQVEVEAIMGYFNNLVPLHLTLDPSLSFLELVRLVKQTSLECFSHPDVPLEYLQRELKLGSDGRGVLYQALFSFQDGRQRIVDWGGLQQENLPVSQSAATQDLGLWFLENTGGMVGGLTYNAGILQPETASLLCDRYLAMFARVLDEPGQPISALMAIRESELQQLRSWNPTPTEQPLPPNLPAVLEAHAERAPDALAMVCGSQSISYAELARRADQIAAALGQRAVRSAGRDAPAVVGLCAAPGFDRTAALFGILRAGATCVLLDPTDPPARLRDIVGDARVDLLVGPVALETALDWPQARALWLDQDTAEGMAGSASRPPILVSSPDALALAIYAPHASGLPRGVAISNRALASMLLGLRGSLGLSTADRVLGAVAPCTGASILSSLLPLCAGAALIEPGAAELGDGQALVGLAQGSGASVVLATPEVWQSVVSTGAPVPAHLKLVSIDGALAPELAQQLAGSSGGLWNVLSLTDVAFAASCGRLDGMANVVHSGRPLPGTAIWILDRDQQPCPIGAIGEIRVGGAALSRPFGVRAQSANEPEADGAVLAGASLLRTAHRGRWLASGVIQEVGTGRRARSQGRDVDLAGIEAQLVAQAGVAQAIAVAREGSTGDRWVDAYVVAEPDRTVDAHLLRAALARVLPAYEVPRNIVLLAALPLLPNGERDTLALPLPPTLATGAADQVGIDSTCEPQTSGEQLLATVWRELLGIAEVQRNDNFFDVGGHSLAAVEMVARVRSQTGVRLNLLDIATGTLASLARELPDGASEPVAETGSLSARLRRLLRFH